MQFKFDLSHLSQPNDENVIGPIQDSEALVLYALVKVTLVRKIVEVGGLDGYSAKNFLQAMGSRGELYTIDINEVPRQADNHFVIKSDVSNVDPKSLGEKPFDLVFFDCHHMAQMNFLADMQRAGLITPNTMIALHDTNAHPFGKTPWSTKNSKGEWIHQPVEREMVNRLTSMGWHALCLHTEMDKHDAALPFRHGLTIMKRFERLEN